VLHRCAASRQDCSFKGGRLHAPVTSVARVLSRNGQNCMATGKYEEVVLRNHYVESTAVASAVLSTLDHSMLGLLEPCPSKAISYVF
jgi:hypothetical protein